MQLSTLERAKQISGQKLRAGEVTVTPERLAKLAIEVGLETLPPLPGHRAGLRILDGPLDQLDKAGKITRREFEGGDRFRGDAYLSAINPTTMSVDWGKAGGGGRSGFVPSALSSQHVYEARQRWRQAEREIGGIVWAVAIMALIREQSLAEIGEALFACKNHRDARYAGLGAFRVTLGALANHYGC